MPNKKNQIKRSHFWKEGKGAFLFGLFQHSHPKEEEEGEEGREGGHVILFYQGEDGKWRRDGIVIETDGPTGFMITLRWNGKGELGRGDGKEGAEGKDGKEETEGDTLVCHAPHLFVLLSFLTTLYGGKLPKFTNISDGYHVH